ncbi:MAG TPA: transglutaminase-like cysteine peptidase, partial [Burkholderiaceae bacterium]
MSGSRHIHGFGARLRGACRDGLLVLAVALAASPAHALDAGRLLSAAKQLGPGAIKPAQALLISIERLAKLEEAQRIAAVNDYINAHIEFYTDQEVWQRDDYWASPLESLMKGRGDCEDYAIAKYFSLFATGVPEARLRMVYVRATLDGRPQAHMVLAYYEQADAQP